MTPGASMAERGRTQIVRGSLSACPTGVIDASRSPNSRLSQKKECLGYVSPKIAILCETGGLLASSSFTLDRPFPKSLVSHRN